MRFSKNLLLVLRSFFFLVCLPFLTTCYPANSGNLKFAVNINKAILLNTTGYSCQSLLTAADTAPPTAPSADIQPIYFTIPTITLTWTQTQLLTLQWIIFSIHSPDISGGSFLCEIASESLLYSWIPQYNPIATGAPFEVTVSNASPLVSPGFPTPGLSNACPFLCGGVTMNNPVQSSYGNVNITMYATYDDGGGNLVPIESQQVISYFYQGTGNL